MGDKHILDDPLSKYSEIRSKMPDGKDAEFLYEQIGVTAEDNLKLLENVHGEILILPLRLLNQSNGYHSLYSVGGQAFISLFNGIDNLNDYFAKCNSIDDIIRFAREDIGRLVMFSEDDNVISFMITCIGIYGDPCFQRPPQIIQDTLSASHRRTRRTAS